MSIPRVLLVIAAAAVAVAVLIGIVASSAGAQTIALTAAAVAGCAVLAVAHVMALQRRCAVWLMRFGLLCNAGWFGLALWMILLASPRGRGGDAQRLALVLAGAAVGTAVIGVSLMQPANGRALRMIRNFTVTLAAGVTVLWFVNVRFELPWTERLAAGLSLMVIAGLLVSLFLGRIRSLLGVQGPNVTLTCPRCDLRQSLRSGGDACAGCGLRIKVLVP